MQVLGQTTCVVCVYRWQDDITPASSSNGGDWTRSLSSCCRRRRRQSCPWTIDHAPPRLSDGPRPHGPRSRSRKTPSRPTWSTVSRFTRGACPTDDGCLDDCRLRACPTRLRHRRLRSAPETSHGHRNTVTSPQLKTASRPPDTNCVLRQHSAHSTVTEKSAKTN